MLLIVESMMFRIFSKKYFKSFILLLGVGMSFSISLAKEIEFTGKTTYVNTIATILALPKDHSSISHLDFIPKRTKLFSFYCNSILIAWRYTDDNFYFSAKKSAFVYLLCKHIGTSSALFIDDDGNTSLSGFFKTTALDKMGFFASGFDKNRPDLYVDELFNAIMSEYFTIKQANIYWFTSMTLSEEDQADQFTAGGGLWNPVPWYFDKIKICDKKNNKYTFDKTCTYLTQYIKNQKKSLSSFNIFDIKNLTDSYDKQSKDTQNPIPLLCTEGKQHGSYDVQLCGLFDPWNKDMKPFVNMLYNEMFYYNLFVQFYRQRLLQEDDLFEWSKTTERLQLQSFVSMKIQNELNLSKKALEMSIRILRDQYWTFPLHIGLLMYWEQLSPVGHSLASLGMPINTLYDEFRNVQCK